MMESLIIHGAIESKKLLSFNFVQDKLTHHFYPVKVFSISPGPLFQLGLPACAPGRLALLSWRASLQWQAGRSPLSSFRFESNS